MVVSLVVPADQLSGRLGRILTQSGDEVWMFAADGLGLLSLSRGAARALGYRPEEWSRLTVLDLLTESSRASLTGILKRLREGRSRPPQTLQCEVLRKDGSRYRAAARLHHARDDEPDLFVAIVQDTAEIDAREAALLGATRSMMALTRATEALIHATDEQELLEDVCHIMVTVAGYRLAWVGYAMPDLSIEPMAAYGIDDGYVAAARMTSDGASERGRGPAGTAIRTGTTQMVRDTVNDPAFAPWRQAALDHGFRSAIALPLMAREQVVGVMIIYSGEPDAFDRREVRLLEDLAGNLSYGIDALRAQKERLRTEQRLLESEERYRTLVEVSPDCIVVHSDGRLAFANPAAERMFRVGRDDSLVGLPVLDLVHPDDQARVARGLAGEFHPVSNAQVKMVRFDGSAFHGEVAVAAVSFHGVDARLVVMRDVTQRKQVDAQLVQAAKLATLGEMAAGMAHELSQPLNIMRMAAEGTLLLMDRNRAGPEHQRNQFTLIADQTRRMAEIIDHIRVFSRKDSGPVETFDALAALRLAAEMVCRQLQDHQIAFEMDLPARPCPVRGRQVQLEQVVVNLLTNAADSVIDRRRREPLAGRVRLSAWIGADGAALVFQVRDNGGGMTPAVMERLFEPFFTTKEAGRGTGLGLSISFGIVSAMDGRLEAGNREDGAALTVTLPLAPAPAEAQPASRVPPPPEGGHHLLVVDDEPLAVATLADHMTHMGYRVSKAASGNAAYRVFMADPADLIITDLRMADGDGHDLIERLRDYDPLLPIVVCSGHLGPTETLAIDADRTVLLRKPVGLEALAEAVADLLAPLD